MDAGITVEGTGEATMPADSLEYRAILVTGGATPSDAMTEYDRALARLPKALDQLGMKGLAFELRGIVFTCLNDEQFRQRQRNAMNYGQQAAPNKCEVRDYVTIRVPIGGLEAKDIYSTAVGIIGASMDLGLEDPEIRRVIMDPYGRVNPTGDTPEGWAPGLTYALRDPAKLYHQAVKNALDDAKAKAQTQVELVGGKLGGVIAMETRSGSRVERGKLRDVRHQVVLRVRFELVR
jgi:hypothetical protein